MQTDNRFCASAWRRRVLPLTSIVCVMCTAPPVLSLVKSLPSLAVATPPTSLKLPDPSMASSFRGRIRPVYP